MERLIESLMLKARWLLAPIYLGLSLAMIALVVIGIPLTLVLIGVPMWLLGGFICGAVGVWFAIRSILGVVYLARGDAYPRPMTWLF